MKKITAIALALVIALGMFAGCSGNKKESEEKTITLWCIATESDANHDAYVKAVEEYEAAHPGVKIEWEAFENQSYKTKIKAAMSDPDTLPDIFFTWAGAFLGDFAAAEAAYCLDDAYKAHKDALPEKMLANSTYNGKHYGVPLTYNFVGMFANMDLLAQAGWDHVPETYEDLTACCDALLAKGIIPFGCAGKETWCVTEYLEPIILKTIGYQDLNEVFAGRATWNNEGIASSVATLQDMIDKGYFDPNGTALSNDEVKANFLAGKTAFYQNGTWNCGEVNDADFNAQLCLFPVMDSAKATYGQLIGGPSDTLAVSSHSKQKELAAEVAFELGKSICHYAYLIGSGLPAWTPDYDVSAVKPMVIAAGDMAVKSDGMVLFGDTAMSADPANTYLSYVDKVYGKEIDGAGFIAGLAKDLQ